MTTPAGTGRLEWRLEDDWAVVAAGEADEHTADAVRGLVTALDDDGLRRFDADLSVSTRIPGARRGVLAKRPAKQSGPTA